MTKSIESRLIIIFGLLILIVMMVSDFFILDRVKNYYNQEIKRRVEYSVSNALLKSIKTAKPSEIQQIVDNTIKQSPYGFSIDKLIVTDNLGKVIASYPRIEGMVFYPSDDILNALSGIKVSRIDVQKQMLILCYPTDKKNVSRTLYIEVSMVATSATIEDIKNILITAHILSLLIAMTLGLLFAKTLSTPIKKLTKKAIAISKGSFDEEIEIYSHDEIGELAQAFIVMTKNLKSNISNLQIEKTKIEKILENMSDGVVALNSQNQLIHINSSAKKMLGESIAKFLEEISKNDDIIQLDNKTYQVTQTPFEDLDGRQGKIYIIHDITEQINLDKMRKAFVANVSHELRTPITTIKSYSETLLDIDDDETKKQFLEVVIKECDRMTRLVSDLLYLSKIDAGESIFEFSQHDISLIAKGVCQKLIFQAKKKNQKIECNITEGLMCLVDKDKIEQVITNIVSNAILYVQEGGVIKLSTYKQDKYACIEISDNGPGIPEEDLPKIFERFYRVDKARSRNLGGSGLGLSIAMEIVKAHNGHIEVESSVGKGTKFTVKIPLS